MENFTIQVVYALPHKQYLFDVSVNSLDTVKDAILKSPLLSYCEEININEVKVGIFSRIVKLDDFVKSGDRIEIYRPLIADPKELRRMRAKRAEQTESK
ncbi:RnfH family protein [Thorsellia kenyensis]|uniref:UPF0125 protein ACFFIT_11335 n=1 Tax=Thorsellia kenyensis TaxID=1549888 RepID=A0ABV6CCF8_9GAMM